MALSDSNCKSHGVVYTPAALVRHILAHSLRPWLEERGAPHNSLCILDPACGDGAFLVDALRMLLHLVIERTRIDHDAQPYSESPGLSATPVLGSELERRVRLVHDHIFGIDIDDAAVQKARQRLARCALGLHEDDRITESQSRKLRSVADSFAKNIRTGDSLRERPFADASFHVIVANPPFVGARRLAQRRSTLSCGDLYVVFVERIFELLTEGGRFGVIVPNKISVTRYARSARELLFRQARIERIDDISHLNAFGSKHVYPVAICGVKSVARDNHKVRITRPTSLDAINSTNHWFVPQIALRVENGFSLNQGIAVESRVPTRQLGHIAKLHSGATGFMARRIAEALAEKGEASGPAWNFVTTGNIDRFCVRLGDVRFMKRRYRAPVLPYHASCLTSRKRQLYQAPKVILAGMSRRLEAAWHDSGLALGVQVFAATELKCVPDFLVALLNSKFMSFVYRNRFQGKQMAGGYLAVNKAQLHSLPVRWIDPEDRKSVQMHHELCNAARRLMRLYADDNVSSDATAELERQIDETVYRLYNLRDTEIRDVEESLSSIP